MHALCLALVTLLPGFTADGDTPPPSAPASVETPADEVVTPEKPPASVEEEPAQAPRTTREKPVSDEAHSDPTRAMIGAAAATFAAFALVNLVTFVIAVVPALGILALQLALTAYVGNLLPGLGIDPETYAISASLAAFRNWGNMFALLAPFFGIWVGLVGVPVAATLGRRVPWFGPWVAAALIPGLGWVAGLLLASVVGIVATWTSFGFFVVRSAVMIPQQAVLAFNVGTSVLFATAAVGVLVGSVLVSQVLAVGAVAMLVRATGRDSVEGEAAMHGDFFRASSPSVEN